MERPSRRQFLQGSLALAGLSLLSGCGVTPPWVQPAAKVPRVGYLANRPPNPNYAAFRQALQDLGYVEGRTIGFEHRVGAEREQYPGLIAELIGLGVDVIVSGDSNAVRAAKAATTTIPIVLAGAGNPVADGLVASAAHPGGNVTGVGYQPTTPLNGKQLELLKEALPGISRVGVLLEPSAPSAPAAWQREQTAALALGLELLRLEISSDADVDGAFEAATGQHVDAIFVERYPITNRNMGRITDSALRTRLPSMYQNTEYVELGGLMAYGVSDVDLQRRAATYVDKILKGAKPADLPLELPAKFDFVINLKTARALGLTIPQEVLMQATEVIE